MLKMQKAPAVAVILAAGQSRRMQSLQPKILSEVANKSMIDSVMTATQSSWITRRVIVTSPS